jgi:adenylate cyclase
MKPILLERTVDLASARGAVWKILRDTERINRAAGSNALTVKPVESGAVRFLVETTNTGFSLVYDEPPYQWTEGEFLDFERRNHGSPVRLIRVRYTLSDHQGGTRIHARFVLTPRWFFAAPIVWMVGRASINAVCRYFATFDDILRGRAALPSHVTYVDRDRAEKLAAPLRDRIGADVVDRLVTHLTTCSDPEAQAMRPFELASSWGRPDVEVLRACLAATREGLLELRWSMLCPSCGQASETLASLRQLTPEGHCHACDLRYGIELDKAVEAVFRPHPSVRTIDVKPLCVAGPMLTPHVVAQGYTEAGGAVELVAPAPGRYRAFARGGARAEVNVFAGGPDAATLTVDGVAMSPSDVTLAPGGKLTVRFADGGSSHAKLERLEWSFRAATAHRVSMIPEFRALFGSEALREGLAMRVTRTTILFSDLCGSTALYGKVGDAAAFGVVTDCLAYGRKHVEDEGGVVIKTMGDAVMAAFPEPASAVRAGAAMIREWSELQKTNALLEHLDLKVGLFGGACTVVAANGVLDYFGQTVNSAARVQHLAGPREVLVPAEIAGEVEAPAGTRYGEAFGARVKGIEEELVLRKLTLDPPA